MASFTMEALNGALVPLCVGRKRTGQKTSLCVLVKGVEEMKRVILAWAGTAAVALAAVSGASAAPVKSSQAFFLDATCTGLGSVTLVNTGPAHTEALQVLGTNTVVLVPFNGAPGIISAGTAAGTSCTFAEPQGPPGTPNPIPVVIIGG